MPGCVDTLTCRNGIFLEAKRAKPHLNFRRGKKRRVSF
jgi:hypothetical protein